MGNMLSVWEVWWLKVWHVKGKSRKGLLMIMWVSWYGPPVSPSQLILHKGSSTNTGHYLSMVKVDDIWFEYDDVKITKIEFNHFCNSNTYFTKEAYDGNILRVIELIPVDTACCVSWGEGMKTPNTQQIPSEHLLPCIVYFHLLLLPFRFFGLCLLLLLLLLLDINHVLFVLNLHMNIQWRCTVWFVIVW